MRWIKNIWWFLGLHYHIQLYDPTTHRLVVNLEPLNSDCPKNPKNNC
jgi:hypothetical protein